MVYEGRHYYNAKLRDFVPLKEQVLSTREMELKFWFSWYCDGKSDAIRNEKKFNKIVEFSRYFVNDYYHKDHVDITDGVTCSTTHRGWRSIQSGLRLNES